MSKKVDTGEVTGEAADAEAEELELVTADEELELVTVDVTPDEIAVRAYHIHLSGSGGDELENWVQAERELEAERAAAGTEEGSSGSE